MKTKLPFSLGLLFSLCVLGLAMAGCNNGDAPPPAGDCSGDKVEFTSDSGEKSCVCPDGQEAWPADSDTCVEKCKPNRTRNAEGACVPASLVGGTPQERTAITRTAPIAGARTVSADAQPVSAICNCSNNNGWVNGEGINAAEAKVDAAKKCQVKGGTCNWSN